MKKFSSLLILGLGTVLMTTTCKKAEDLEVDNESQTVIDYTLAHQEFCTMPGIIYKLLLRTKSASTGNYAIQNGGMSWQSGDTLTFSEPREYSCETAAIQAAMPDGNERSGEIRVKITAQINQPGAIVTATLSGYTVNGITYEAAVLSMTTVGEASNYLGVQYSVQGAQCLRNGTSFSYSGNHRLAIYYAGGPQYSTAYYTVYGKASGKSRSGLKYTAEVIKDQLKTDQCGTMSAGTAELVPDGFKPKTLNFGEGQCDDLADFTIAENTISFKLK